MFMLHQNAHECRLLAPVHVLNNVSSWNFWVVRLELISWLRNVFLETVEWVRVSCQLLSSTDWFPATIKQSPVQTRCFFVPDSPHSLINNNLLKIETSNHGALISRNIHHSLIQCYHGIFMICSALRHIHWGFNLHYLRYISFWLIVKQLIIVSSRQVDHCSSSQARNTQ